MARPGRRQCGVFANANINQQDLIAWLDAQKQKPFLRVTPLMELYITSLRLPPPQESVGLTNVFYLKESLISDAGELEEQGRSAGKRKPENGVLIKDSQDLLQCVKWG